jgi:hypothetical protein
MDFICMRDIFNFHCTVQAVYVALALNFPEGLPVAKEASIVNLLLLQTSIKYRGLTASKTTKSGWYNRTLYVPPQAQETKDNKWPLCYS